MNDRSTRDWTRVRQDRNTRFDLAFGAALIKAANKLEWPSTVGAEEVRALATAPYADLIRIIERSDTQVQLLITLDPKSTFDRIFATRSPRERSDSTDDFFVPPGFRSIDQEFTEFAANSYITELLQHLPAYVELYHFRGLSGDGLESVIDWQLDAASQQRFSDHIRRHYIDNPWEKERWVDAALPGDKLERLIDQTRVRRVVEEDRGWDVDQAPIALCAMLLVDGPIGFWEKNRKEISSGFRAAFLDGSKLAAVIGDDGKIVDVDQHWWQGDECTRLLLSRQFRRPDGVLLARTDASHASDVALGPLPGDQLGQEAGRPSSQAPGAHLMHNVATGMQRFTAPPLSDYEQAVQEIYGRLAAMVDAGDIPSRPHTREKLEDLYRQKHGTPASERKLTDAVGKLTRAFPILNKKRGAPRKSQK